MTKEQAAKAVEKARENVLNFARRIASAPHLASYATDTLSRLAPLIDGMRAAEIARDALDKPRLRSEREFMNGRVLWSDVSVFEFAWTCVTARDNEWLALLPTLARETQIDKGNGNTGERWIGPYVLLADLKALRSACAETEPLPGHSAEVQPSQGAA